MRSTSPLLLLAAALAGALVFALIPRATAEKSGGTGTGCGQYEVTISNPTTIVNTNEPLPTVGATPAAMRLPAGWEPFAYAPGGQLAYRRCVTTK